MSDDERPRKLAKIENAGESTEQEFGPAMTGAVPANNESEKTDAQITNESTLTSSEIPRDATKESTETAPANEAEEGAPKISKNQLKRLRRQAKWEEERDVRKAKRKDLAQKKKERRYEEIKEARANGGAEAVAALKKQWGGARGKSRRSKLLPFTIVVDCGYDELMTSKERISLSSQLTRIYSDNTHSPWRGNLIFSTFDKLLKERFDTTLSSHKLWKGIQFIPEDFVQAAEMAKGHMASPRGGRLVGPFDKYPDAKPEDGEVIYLSSDSENTLTELKPYCTYIIGGLVDKNRYKAVCYKNAVGKGVKTAKLPISQYIKMTERSVLTTNHVVDIMLKWLELGDWGEAFMKVLPPRKGGQLKVKSGDQDDGNVNAEADGGAEEEVVEDEQEESDVTLMEQIMADAAGEEEDEHE
ncbi:tRNA (guanine(9)-N(1))-methyltransferase TRM10 [Penicillium manginii]|uniref:tRNA (guanine(9)-N(1))-methyltransferase TRM10 n=1 Tax=Penicillium manginii TaxID=203109 RepID=UPI0025471F64|nr:tRNA (guanine(9)-N(1))-methyltransferase TRM10 [Penicillium manginii]KAJ5768466.1 tRNA (guanine(9)-N(1))-methyltransferase TRM10 [Penicillium manginii]